MHTQLQIRQSQQVEQQILLHQLSADFLNVLALATDAQETINFFHDVPDHVMIEIQMNKLILQLNISNMLHRELVEEVSNLQWKQRDLNSTKQQFTQYLQPLITSYDPRIQELLKLYMCKNLIPVPQVYMLEGKKVNLKKTFDASVAESVIQGIQASDIQFEKIRNGEKVSELNKSKIDNYIMQRQHQARAGIGQNWNNKKFNMEYRTAYLEKQQQPITK